MKNDKVRINEKERHLISSTSPHDCWICDRLANEIRKDKKGYYLKKQWLKQMGWTGHLSQIIKKVI
jgi:hypothetical protein